MGRKSNAKALRPPSAIADTVARIEARIAKMDALHPGWAGYLDSMIRDISRDWPEWCLIPMAGATAVVQHVGVSVGPAETAEMTALFTWSKGRSVYRFDPDLASSVLATPMTDIIPTELFYRLPEWGIYIEAPPNGLWPNELAGAFVHLEYDTLSGARELRIYGDPVGDIGDTVIPLHIHGNSTVEEMLATTLRVAEETARSFNVDVDTFQLPGSFSQHQDLLDQIKTWITPIVSCIMYLCTNDADIIEATTVHQKNRTQNPLARARQKDVGFRIGAALRSTKTRSQDAAPHEPTGRHVTPHLRRAHWHHFWTGSLKDPSQRELIVKWIPPVPVNLDKGEIVTVVRNVR